MVQKMLWGPDLRGGIGPPIFTAEEILSKTGGGNHVGVNSAEIKPSFAGRENGRGRKEGEGGGRVLFHCAGFFCRDLKT